VCLCFHPCAGWDGDGVYQWMGSTHWLVRHWHRFQLSAVCQAGSSPHGDFQENNRNCLFIKEYLLLSGCKDFRRGVVRRYVMMTHRSKTRSVAFPDSCVCTYVYYDCDSLFFPRFRVVHVSAPLPTTHTRGHLAMSTTKPHGVIKASSVFW
jgi:hypothetical protein